jgi:hypothetical protein
MFALKHPDIRAVKAMPREMASEFRANATQSRKQPATVVRNGRTTGPS